MLIQLFNAIRFVETGHCSHSAEALGDDGKSLGPYQIQLCYWQDATRNHPDLAAKGYEAVKDNQYAEQIMIAYWQQYCPKELEAAIDGCQKSLEHLAKVHNGGHNGADLLKTQDYWEQVKKQLTGL